MLTVTPPHLGFIQRGYHQNIIFFTRQNTLSICFNIRTFWMLNPVLCVLVNHISKQSVNLHIFTFTASIEFIFISEDMFHTLKDLIKQRSQ